MTEAEFWKIVEETNGEYQTLQTTLAACSVEEILAFDDHVARLMSLSYSGDLWCAAYIACGGCSDDSFDYFRAWLIGQGQAVFEAACNNPDSLCDTLLALRDEDPDNYPANEDLLCVAGDAYNEKTKTTDFYNLPRVRYPHSTIEFRWNSEDADSMQAVCPRIFETFYEEPL